MGWWNYIKIYNELIWKRNKFTRSASKEVSNNIFEVMDLLDDESSDNSVNYTIKCFSSFDHRLTNEEACGEIPFYDHAMEHENTDKSRVYLSYNDKFVNFYTNLYSVTQVYGVIYDSRCTGHIIEFDNIEEYKSHALLSIREKLSLKLVLPEFYAIIVGGFDLTHLLYTLKSKPDNLQKLSSIIQSNGLFVLD